MVKTLFLPGAAGSASFWKPVAAHLQLDAEFFAWPGLGDEPPHPQVNSINALVDIVASRITEPVNIVAQSMGGIIAVRLALLRPHLVRCLVLTATSGGVPVDDLGGTDWRPEYFAEFPTAASWIADPVSDLSKRIPSIETPVLLLWGDADPISPVPVGERLSALFPNAHLCVVPGAAHDLAQSHARLVATEIEQHLLQAS